MAENLVQVQDALGNLVGATFASRLLTAQLL